MKISGPFIRRPVATTLFTTPVIYVACDRLAKRLRGRQGQESGTLADTPS